MTWLLALLTLLFGSTATPTQPLQAPPAPVAASQTALAPVQARTTPKTDTVQTPEPTTTATPEPPPTPAPGIATVNDPSCPASAVQQTLIRATDGSSQTYPICFQPPTASAVWACIHYLPAGAWSVDALAVDQSTGYPDSTSCGADNLGDPGRVAPAAVTG